MSRSEALDIIPFGHNLLVTRDLDPEYILLWEAKFPKELLKKWLLAYWCFSHAGTASWIASAEDDERDERYYWDRMMQAANLPKQWKRGVARRYFVGEDAAKAVNYLSSAGLKGTVNKLCNHYFWYLPDFMAEVCGWYKFGPWAAFKAADMLERLDLIGLNSNKCEDCMLEAPKKGARDLWECRGSPSLVGWSVERWAVKEILTSKLGGYKAPPRYERLINLQEAETILCKWRGHIRKERTYNVGDDIRALRKELDLVKCPITEQLINAGVDRGLWG